MYSNKVHRKKSKLKLKQNHKASQKTRVLLTIYDPLSSLNNNQWEKKNKKKNWEKNYSKLEIQIVCSVDVKHSKKIVVNEKLVYFIFQQRVKTTKPRKGLKKWKKVVKKAFSKVLKK